jgi:hypothetical protein
MIGAAYLSLISFPHNPQHQRFPQTAQGWRIGFVMTRVLFAHYQS